MVTYLRRLREAVIADLRNCDVDEVCINGDLEELNYAFAPLMPDGIPGTSLFRYKIEKAYILLVLRVLHGWMMVRELQSAGESLAVLMSCTQANTVALVGPHVRRCVSSVSTWSTCSVADIAPTLTKMPTSCA